MKSLANKNVYKEKIVNLLKKVDATNTIQKYIKKNSKILFSSHNKNISKLLQEIYKNINVICAQTIFVKEIV